MTRVEPGQTPNGDPRRLKEEIDKYLTAIRSHVTQLVRERGGPQVAMSQLGFTRENLFIRLHSAAQRFLENRRADDAAATDRDLLEELRIFVGHSDEEIVPCLRTLRPAAFDALCGTFPGHRYVIGAYGDDTGTEVYLQPDHDALRAETLKNLWRRETDGPGRGFATLRRAEPVAACIPLDAEIETLLTLIDRVVAALGAASGTEDKRETLLKVLAASLIVQGNFGIPERYEPMLEMLRDIVGMDGVASLIREVSPLILEDLEERGAGRGRQAILTIIMLLLDRVEEIERSDRRLVLMCLASVYPAAFRAFIQRTAEGLSRQYGGEAERRGRERSTRRWIEAHAGWYLIVDVLDVVWPVDFGSLGKTTMRAVFNIIYETFIFSDNVIPENINNAANYSINKDHITAISSMRLAISELNEILSVLDRRLLYEIEPMPNPPTSIREEASQLRKTIESLQMWRRELRRRLRQGDYLKGTAGRARKQASGARVEIPGIPLKVRCLPEDERRAAICALALEWSARRSAKPHAAPLSETDTAH